MPSRASKRKPGREDLAEMAFRIVQQGTGQIQAEPEEPKVYDNPVSAAAAALSRLGASKGGKARAESMTAAKRKAIAKKAAAARWSKRP